MAASSLTIRRIDTRAPGWESELNALRARLSPQGNIVSDAGRRRTMEVFGAPLTPQEVVARICDDVRQEGLAAVLRYSSKLDRADLTAESLRVPEDEFDRAHAAADPAFLATIRRIRDNIRRFQSAILHRDVELRPSDGVVLRQRYLPLRRIGICVPGGAAAYPSTVLMTAVPAQAAGVDEIVVIAPPTPFGAYNPDLLATCRELGIGEVYRVGGAQGVAALAYGVEGLHPVDKIVGPGNLFVALAKKRVYGDVDIDSIAGPSEVVIVADEHAPASFIASDMLAQAEHAPGSSVLIAWSDGVLNQVEQELQRQVPSLSRGAQTIDSLTEFGAMIRVNTSTDASRIVDLLAPEHLHLAVSDASRLLNEIRNAGAIFVGYHTPVAVGDYAAGPSHVLPTGGTARWASGLSANDFLRAGSVIQFDESALRAIAPDVCLMADKEGLTAHRGSVDVRTR